jgi:light-regulated signal transduction histidine kinase (bacteriophytochrome)
LPVTESFEPLDVASCDREPVYLLGAIRPIGFLIALSDQWTAGTACRSDGAVGAHMLDYVA